MPLFENIYVVLVGITHPGNIGGAARAMRNMGLTQLRLVQPKRFPHAEATARASGACDVLANAQVYDNFAESIQDCHLVCGTSARSRNLNWSILTPRQSVEKILQTSQKVAIVFGREHAGLTNEELDHCHYLIQIPTMADFSSLNIAAAVQVIAYELRCTYLAMSQPVEESVFIEEETLASAELMQLFYEHLRQTLIDIEFLDPTNPRRLIRRLQRLYNRSQLTESEINILRGILTATQKQCQNRQSHPITDSTI